MLIVLLIFSSSSARVADQTKYLSFDDEPCMIRPTLIDLNPIELTYYPFMISLVKCNGRGNVLLPKIYVKKQRKQMLKCLIW